MNKIIDIFAKLWFEILLPIINKSKRNILITCFTTSTHLNFRIQTWIRSTYAFLDVDNGYFDFSLYPTSSSVFNQCISINPKIICNSSPSGHYALFIKLVSMELNHIEVIAFLFPQIRDHSKHICVRLIWAEWLSNWVNWRLCTTLI